MHHIPGNPFGDYLPKTLSEPTINSHLDAFALKGAIQYIGKFQEGARVRRRYRLVNSELLYGKVRVPKNVKSQLDKIFRASRSYERIETLKPVGTKPQKAEQSQAKVKSNQPLEKPTKDLERLWTDKTGFNEIAARYNGVIITIVSNPPERWSFSTKGLEEGFDFPVDEVVLDHVLRGMYLEFGLDRNYAVDDKGLNVIINAEVLADGHLSERDISKVLRTLRFRSMDKIQLTFEVNLRKLEAFLHTRVGKLRLWRAIDGASQEYKAEIRKGFQRALPDAVTFEEMRKKYGSPKTREMGRATS
jgi:hypothetical protein